nr:MAG TPA: hypothetical protein [Caudoviricetes sp.]
MLFVFICLISATVYWSNAYHKALRYSDRLFILSSCSFYSYKSSIPINFL